MTENIIKRIIDDTKSSLNNLNHAISVVKKIDQNRKNTALYFDGLIKRYEILFSKATNLLRLSLIQEGIEAISPRQTIKEAVRLNWIGDVDFWLVALDAKMSSINGISDLEHQEYQNIACQFSTEVEVIINVISELRNV